jgi:hypothetical protein
MNVVDAIPALFGSLSTEVLSVAAALLTVTLLTTTVQLVRAMTDRHAFENPGKLTGLFARLAMDVVLLALVLSALLPRLTG